MTPTPAAVEAAKNKVLEFIERISEKGNLHKELYDDALLCLSSHQPPTDTPREITITGYGMEPKVVQFSERELNDVRARYDMPVELEGLREAIEWFEKIVSDANNTYPPKISDRYGKILKAARLCAQSPARVNREEIEALKKKERPYSYDDSFTRGWNACIDAIIGDL